MNKPSEQPLFPIRVICERTGVGASTLRAWERRYGILQPQRTPKGHRLYSEADVQLIQRILDLLNQGHSIGQSARLIRAGGDIEVALPGASARLISGEPPEPDGSKAHWEAYLSRLLQAVTDYNLERLDAVYNEASANYPVDLVSRLLILPALESLGRRWQKDMSGIGEEHFFTAWLRNKLGARLHHSASLATGTNLVIACVPGHRHEIGALLFSLTALGRGYRTIYLGADMPLEPIVEIVTRTRAGGVILAAGQTPAVNELVASLGGLNRQLSVPLFVGGRFAVSYGDALAEQGIYLLGEQFQLAIQLVATRVPVHPGVNEEQSE